MRVAVTGAGGRLGRAVLAALNDAPFTGPSGAAGWTRNDFDLDHPEGIERLLPAFRPDAIVHCAAWTDVDGCAREPDLANARNGEATRVLAEAAAARGIDLVVISTNEVFDGTRVDGVAYSADEPTNPPNPYGASKVLGEQAASAVYDRGSAQLAIARTAWLFGTGKPDFPMKVLANAERARAAGEPLRLVGDEWGTPTYVNDVADAIVELLGSGEIAGTHHLVNGTRAHWGTYTVARAGIDVGFEEVPAATWPRPSNPPRWGVLAQTPLPSGEPMRPWPDAMADYAPTLLRAHRAAMQASGASGS
jgi:dTDP-4-dehydrorhamnose reductase